MRLTVVSLKEGQYSDKPWASVDKSKLPKSCYLYIEGDGKTKDQWHLPYREGAGEIGEDGMYTQAGPINKGAIRAIGAALGGAHTGKAMSVPASVRARYRRLRKQVLGLSEEKAA